MANKKLEKRNRDRRERRSIANFRAANVVTTNSRKMEQLSEDIILNPRRHRNIQNLAKDQSKRYVRTIMLIRPTLDNGIKPRD